MAGPASIARVVVDMMALREDVLVFSQDQS